MAVAGCLTGARRRPEQGRGRAAGQAKRSAALSHGASTRSWAENQPGTCFRCGPLALYKILNRSGLSASANSIFEKYKSPTNGFSLPQVAELSGRLGLNYQMAFRSAGAALIVPSVVHWKVGHYAAVLEQRGDRFLVQDFTFPGSIWMTTNALEQEGSGYFLVPPGTLPAGWRGRTRPRPGTAG